LELFVSVTGIGALVSVICVPANKQVSGIPLQPDNVSSGVSINVPAADIVPGGVGVTTTGVALLTTPAVAIKVFEFMPAGTVTDDEGEKTTDGLLLRLITVPGAGAIPVSVTVPVIICPEATVMGAGKDTIVATGGITVRPPTTDVPLGSVAVIVTSVLLATGFVPTLIGSLLVAPGLMVKLGGTGSTATPGLLLTISVPVKLAAGGAGPLRTTVPTVPAPPVSVLGMNVKDMIVAGFTVRIGLAFGGLIPSVAVTVTGVAIATPTVVSVNDAEVVLPAGTVTVPVHPLDNMTGPEQVLKLKETDIPPAGAAGLMVTVPVG
jgi:hypothetical protein